GEPAAEAGPVRFFGAVVVEDDHAGNVLAQLAAAETVGEVVVVLLRGNTPAGGIDVVPVLHVVGLGSAGGTVVAHSIVAQRVLDVLGRDPVHAEQAPAFNDADFVGVPEAPAPAVHDEVRPDADVAGVVARRRRDPV